MKLALPIEVTSDLPRPVRWRHIHHDQQMHDESVTAAMKSHLTVSSPLPASHGVSRDPLVHQPFDVDIGELSLPDTGDVDIAGRPL